MTDAPSSRQPGRVPPAIRECFDQKLSAVACLVRDLNRAADELVESDAAQADGARERRAAAGGIDDEPRGDA